MRFNLRYVVPVMCGTCIVLTVSVAAAVGGISDGDGDIARLSSVSRTESYIYHSNDFTAPAANSARKDIGADDSAEADDTVEGSDTDGGIAETMSDFESGYTADSSETVEIAVFTTEGTEIIQNPVESAETGAFTENAVIEDASAEADDLSNTDKLLAAKLPEAEELPADDLHEESTWTVNADSETKKPTEEVLSEADKPAEEAGREAVGVGYDEPQRQAMLEAVNAVRAEYGLTPLSEMSEISEIAQQRARECASYFSHTRPNGTKWHTLLSEAGLKRSVRAENIAYYYPTAQQALDSWLGDYSHRANILNAEAAYIGIGYYCDGYNSYWVQIFLGE